MSEKGIDKLTDKQTIFCHEYTKHWNATQAAITAGYPEKTARQIASQNLSKIYIQDYIRGLMTSAGIDRDSIVKTLSDAFNLDQTKLIEAVKEIITQGENGQTFTTYEFDTSVIPEDMRKFIDVEYTPSKGATLKSPPKLKLLENIIKVKGLFAPTKVEANIDWKQPPEIHFHSNDK